MRMSYTVTDRMGKVAPQTFATTEMANHHAAVMSLCDRTQYRMYFGVDRFAVSAAPAF